RTDAHRRRLFTRFVEEHLREHGIEVREHEAIKCRGCGREISEEVVHANIAAGEPDVVCQWCRTHTLISEGVAKIRERDPQSDQKIYALRKEIVKRTAEDAEKAKQAIAAKNKVSEKNEPIRILHLSDLHFTKGTSPKTKLQWLLQDIRNGESLGFDSVEYIVISGDITDKGNEEGFEKAREFVSLLNEELRVSAERCIFVPGNHDVQDMEEVYDWHLSEAKAKKAYPDDQHWHREGNVIFVPNKDKYPLRLKKFSDAFFHKIIAKAYPMEYSLQGIAYLFPATCIQFVTLNSCWQIDQFNRKRSGVHPDAVAHVIAESERQIKDAIKRGEIKNGQRLLRIGVWHHSIAHPETIRNTDFIGHLQNAGVRICLHGDVHETNREEFRYWHPKKMNVAGAGSFGSPPEGRPESMPRLYNLIEVKKDFSSVRVHTRRQMKPDGAWSAWNEWPREDGSPGGVPWYDINLI
ncbi:MAG TPA: metallophosphoesterase, partial [Blastocatellia bacterium]|nr:metallophosphoesterase [Blastocatellia bacterium]